MRLKLYKYDKKTFLMVFKEVWKAAFTVKNIKKAWAKTGVYLVDSSKTDDMIAPKTKPEKLLENPPTLMTCHSVKRVSGPKILNP